MHCQRDLEECFRQSRSLFFVEPPSSSPDFETLFDKALQKMIGGSEKPVAVERVQTYDEE